MNYSKWLLSIVALMLVLLIVSGCSVIEEVLATPTNTPTPELGQEGNPIVWVFASSGEREQVTAGVKSMSQWLHEETGLYFEMVMVNEYAGVVEAMCSNPPEAQIGSLTAFGYVLAAGWGCAESELIAIRHGSVTYNSQIITRFDSGIRSIADLAGTTFCRPDPLSTTGWVIPMLLMQTSGIDPDYDLAEIIEAGSPEGVVVGVYDGVCDVGATYVDARSSIESNYPDVMDRVTVIARGEEIPNEGVQYAPDLPQELRDQITVALLRMTEDEEAREILQAVFDCDGFELHDDAFYDPLRQILEDAGLNGMLDPFPQ